MILDTMLFIKYFLITVVIILGIFSIKDLFHSIVDFTQPAKENKIKNFALRVVAFIFDIIGFIGIVAGIGVIIFLITKFS